MENLALVTFLFPRFLSLLAMCRTQVFGLGILNYAAQWFLKNASFWPFVKAPLLRSTREILTNL